MNPYLNTAIKAARAAGNIIIRASDRLDLISVQTKDKNDFVSNIDKQAEAEIITMVRKAYPHHAILAEESGETGDNDVMWIIDPLDGTNNFIHGFPHFAVSIAIKVAGKIEHGVIYDPIRNELFIASRGRGAQLNDRRLRVSKCNKLDGALLSTGFHHTTPERTKAYLMTYARLMEDISGMRRAGSAALDLAYVAAGRLDGFWEMGLKPWDMAAGILLVREAGGLTADFKGGEKSLQEGEIVAANPKLIKELLRVSTLCFA